MASHFLEALLRHHASRASAGKVFNALQHCHVRGVTSIMLHDEPENRVRLFYATSQHEMHHCYPHDRNQTLAIHPHHCDVRLVPIMGELYNELYMMKAAPNGLYHKCYYRSAITGTRGTLESTGEMYDAQLHQRQQLHAVGILLRADELHSVWTPRGQSAAWVVFETAEDINYKSVCYTRNPVFDTTGMYIPMTASQVFNVLYTIYEATRGK